ncbi:MAG: glycosyltransferase family 4 protein [Mariprofundaceae bacterium]|nr:glycosyltransferase family 4 protein [Mariprofundaceae bacterium]
MPSSSLVGQKVAIVSTVPYFLVNQLSRHIFNLRAQGVDVTVITSPGDELQALEHDDGIHIITMDIARNIHLWKDLKALFKLLCLFRRYGFSLVHSTTPKAGLLCAIAARLAGTKVCLHTFTGQVWATKQGLMRWLLQSMDKVIVRCNTHCYTDSPSQRDFLVEMKVAGADQLSTYGHGSLAGVDLKIFSQNRFDQAFRDKLKARLSINAGVLIFTFIGRMTRDKGIYELLAAYELLQAEKINIALLILGPVESSDHDLLKTIHRLKNVHSLGYVDDTPSFLSITDVLCLPSYREGFGTVVLEAAAMAIPTVGSDIVGLRDAVEDQKTGLLVPVYDKQALYQALKQLFEDLHFRLGLGEAAKKRCECYFSSKQINHFVFNEYQKWLK